MPAPIVSISAEIPEADVRAFTDAFTRFSSELGNSVPVAVRRGTIAFLKSVRARTKSAPKIARPKEYVAVPYSGSKPHYITNARASGHGRSAGLILHRWTLTRRAGTPEQNTHDYYVYSHLRHNKRGEIVKDLAAERRELLKYHASIRMRGLARKSWGFAMKQLFGQQPTDGDSKVKVTPDMVHSRFDKATIGGNVSASCTIHNRIRYISDALEPGAMADAMRAATNAINKVIDERLARKELLSA